MLPKLLAAAGGTETSWQQLESKISCHKANFSFRIQSLEGGEWSLLCWCKKTQKEASRLCGLLARSSFSETAGTASRKRIAVFNNAKKSDVLFCCIFLQLTFSVLLGLSFANNPDAAVQIISHVLRQREREAGWAPVLAAWCFVCLVQFLCCFWLCRNVC